MNIIVCIKQIPDPEIPTGKFKIDPEAKRFIPPEGIPPVINPFDAQAIEAALRLKERHGAKVTAVTMGGHPAEDVVRYAISMGVNEGIVVNDEAFEGSDSFATAYILSKAIERIGQYDLILCGRLAADWDAGQVGSIIGEELGLPIVTTARAVDLTEGKLRVERVISDGYQVFEVTMPALVTISDEICPPRLPSGWGVITAAMSKQIPTWTAQDIGVDPSKVGASAARSKLLELSIPAKGRKGEAIEGETAAEAATNLAIKLRKAGII